MRKTIRSTRYNVSMCLKGDYEAFRKFLDSASYIGPVAGEGYWENYLMPGGERIGVLDKRHGAEEGEISFAVQRTSRRIPRYIKNLAERLGANSYAGTRSYTIEGLAKSFLD